MRRPLLAAALISLTAFAAAGTAHASPCAQPAEYVKVTRGADAERQPLQRPYLVGGLAVLAVRQHGAQPWLELAVDSADTARRSLGGLADKARFETRDGAVLVSCLGLQASVAQRKAGIAAPIW
jgi:hypothetical protein